MANDYAIANLLNDTGSLTRAAAISAAGGAAAATTQTTLASKMVPSVGTVRPRTFNAGPAWGMAHSATASVGCYVDPVPTTWATININLLFTVTAGTSGGIRFKIDPGYWTAASGGTKSSILATCTLTSPSTAGVQTFAIATAITTATVPLVWWRDATRTSSLVISRVGDDAADTYAGDVNLLAVQIVKAS